MPVEDYSTTPEENITLFAEGMNPSDVNDRCRDLMADIKLKDQDAGWHNIGDPSGTKTGIYVSATQFSMTGDQTGEYHVGRKIRLQYPISTDLFGTITASVHDSGSNITTVTVQTNDGAGLPNETSTPHLGASVEDTPIHTIANAYYSGSGTVRLQEFRINGAPVGGVEWNGTSLSLVTD